MFKKWKERRIAKAYRRGFIYILTEYYLDSASLAELEYSTMKEFNTSEVENAFDKGAEDALKTIYTALAGQM